MVVKNAKFEDMAQAGRIMSVSFRTAFADFVSQETMDACAQEENCIALLEGIFKEGKVHFLMGENSGMLAWQQTEDGAEIIAIHTLSESRGTGLGHAMLTAALSQIGTSLFSSGHSSKTPAPAASTKNTASSGTEMNASASLTAHWKCDM